MYHPNLFRKRRDRVRFLVEMAGVIAAAVLAALTASGCAATGASLDVNKMLSDYYNQERSYESLKITGAEKLTIEGENVGLVVRNEMQPLSIKSTDPSVTSKALDTAGSVLKAAAVGYFGVEGMKELTKAPTIVEQPAPIIVQTPAATQ